MIESFFANDVAVGLLAAAMIPVSFAVLFSGPLRSFIRGSGDQSFIRRRGRRRRPSKMYAPPTWTSSTDEG